LANHCQRNDYDLSFGSKNELFLWLTSKTQCLVFFKKTRLLQVMRKASYAKACVRLANGVKKKTGKNLFDVCISLELFC